MCRTRTSTSIEALLPVRYSEPNARASITVSEGRSLLRANTGISVVSRELFGTFLCYECLGEFVKSPIQYLRDVVDRHLDAMIGDSVLREVISPDLFRTIYRPNLRLSGSRLLGHTAIQLGLIKTCSQDAHSLLSILQL